MIEKIQELISRDKLDSKSRERELVHKRIYLFALMRSHGYKLQEIAAMFNRNHSTVIHGIRNYKLFKRKKDPLFSIDVMEYMIIFETKDINLKRDIFEDLKSCKMFRDLEVIKKRIDNGMY